MRGDEGSVSERGGAAAVATDARKLCCSCSSLGVGGTLCSISNAEYVVPRPLLPLFFSPTAALNPASIFLSILILFSTNLIFGNALCCPACIILSNVAGLGSARILMKSLGNLTRGHIVTVPLNRCSQISLQSWPTSRGSRRASRDRGGALRDGRLCHARRRRRG